MKPNSFLTIICVIVIIILVIRDCRNTHIDGKPTVTITVKHDTTYSIKDTTIYKDKIKWVNSIPPKPIDTAGLSLNVNDSCPSQYNKLLNKYASTNVYQDTLRFDSSFVSITDSVQFNKNKNRSYELHLKLPVIRTTITKTITLPSKRQLYIGFGIGGNQANPINLAQSGFLYKDRKDRIYQLNIQTTADLKPSLVISRYWKL